MIRPNQRPQLRRPGLTLRRPANHKSSRELKEKENKRVEESRGTEKLALPRVTRMPPRPMPPRPTLARPEKPRKKPRKKLQRGDVGTVPAEGMFSKSRAITATRRAIMPSTALSQKTSDSLDDFQGPYGRVPYI